MCNQYAKQVWTDTACSSEPVLGKCADFHCYWPQLPNDCKLRCLPGACSSGKYTGCVCVGFPACVHMHADVEASGWQLGSSLELARCTLDANLIKSLTHGSNATHGLVLLLELQLQSLQYWPRNWDSLGGPLDEVFTCDSLALPSRTASGAGHDADSSPDMDASSNTSGSYRGEASQGMSSRIVAEPSKARLRRLRRHTLYDAADPGPHEARFGPSSTTPSSSLSSGSSYGAAHAGPSTSRVPSHQQGGRRGVGYRSRLKAGRDESAQMLLAAAASPVQHSTHCRLADSSLLPADGRALLATPFEHAKHLW